MRPAPRWGLLFPLLLLAGAHAGPAAGQAMRSAPGAVPPPAFPAPPTAAGLEAPGWLRTPAGAFGASLVVPGAGQAALGLRRWVLYGLAEAGLWALYLDARWDEGAYRDRYRDLAWESARLHAGERRDGGWGYYEAMSHYLSSGAYDTDPARAGVQPETSPATYNGVVWELARGLFLAGGPPSPETPGYAEALDYYATRAAGPEFLWSWAGRESELARFRDLIDRTDDEARLATRAAGLVLANHLVAAIDALLVARLREESGLRLRSGLDTTGRAPRWRIGFELPTPYRTQ